MKKYRVFTDMELLVNSCGKIIFIKIADFNVNDKLGGFRYVLYYTI